MTFISGARITRNATTAPGGIHDCPNRYVFSRLLNVFSDRRLLSRSADGRLFHTVGPWKAKLRWPTDVCTLGRSTANNITGQKLSLSLSLSLSVCVSATRSLPLCVQTRKAYMHRPTDVQTCMITNQKLGQSDLVYWIYKSPGLNSRPVS